MANDYLLELRHIIDAQSTRVILTDEMQWANARQLSDKHQRFTELFEQYRKAWIDLKLADLQALYNDGAWPIAAKQHGLTANLKRASIGTTREARSRHAASLSNITTDSLAILAVPGIKANGHFIQMSFHHGEKSETKTTLYWHQLGSGQWQIVHERHESSGA